MASPVWKIYSPGGEYIGCVRDSEDAAALVALRGNGSTVRWSHKHIVWREGAEDFSAGESYDGAARVMRQRVHAVIERGQARLRAGQERFQAQQEAARTLCAVQNGTYACGLAQGHPGLHLTAAQGGRRFHFADKYSPVVAA